MKKKEKLFKLIVPAMQRAAMSYHTLKRHPFLLYVSKYVLSWCLCNRCQDISSNTISSFAISTAENFKIVFSIFHKFDLIQFQLIAYQFDHIISVQCIYITTVYSYNAENLTNDIENLTPFM